MESYFPAPLNVGELLIDARRYEYYMVSSLILLHFLKILLKFVLSNS